MALSLQDGVQVWQKVKQALTNANPATQNAFRVLREYIATQGQNPQLQFVPFTAAQIVTNNGFAAADVACTLYGVYANGARTTGTTSAFFAIHAAADNSATTTTILTERFKATGQSFGAVFPSGMAVETALTVSCATAVGGATESSAADAANGFVLVGA
jgi:hypothetical protein